MQKDTTQKIKKRKKLGAYFGCSECDTLVPNVIAQKITKESSILVAVSILNDKDRKGEFEILDFITIKECNSEYNVIYICGDCGSSVVKLKLNTHGLNTPGDKHE